MNDININPMKLLELTKYQMQLKTNDSEVVLLLRFPLNWKVVAPTNEKITCGERNGITYYHAVITDTIFDEIFKAIDETIELNRELEAKVALLKEKNAEMVELFQREDLETLKTLKFTLKKPRNKKNSTKAEEIKPVSETESLEQSEDVLDEVTSEAKAEEPSTDNGVRVEDITYTPPTEGEITSYEDLIG